MRYDPNSFKNLYMGYLACFLFAMVGMFAAGFTDAMFGAGRQPGDPPSMPAVVMMLLSLPLLLAGVVLYCMLLYRMWAQIQDGRARTTPGKAVGFMFIPLFNFYWVFVAFYGLSQDLNAYVAERSIPTPRITEGLALTSCILIVCSIIPCVGALAALANLVILLISLWQMVVASKAVAQAKPASTFGV